MRTEDREWMRDIGALLALPSLWVDHAPGEIADGLLSVLMGMLRLDAALARFVGPDGGEPLEAWRPTGPSARASLLAAAAAEEGSGGGRGVSDGGVSDGAVSDRAAGVSSRMVHSRDADGEPVDALAKVATLALALPWGSGLVAVSAPRPDFPTERETHLLRVAVGQAAIALHTARRLAREQRARREAEQDLERNERLLRMLIEDVTPALQTASRRMAQAARDAERPRQPTAIRASAPSLPVETTTAAVTPTLTRRELEVLGLLAQGLSNKEMAGALWLSDRTIERHITSLYRKIGVARRSEATAYALRHGIA